jgi:hypothetical protein
MCETGEPWEYPFVVLPVLPSRSHSLLKLSWPALQAPHLQSSFGWVLKKIVSGFIEKAFQINGCTPFMTLRQYRFNMFNGWVLAHAAMKSKIWCRKGPIEYPLKNQIHALGYNSIYYNQYAQLPLLAIFLFEDQHFPWRLEDTPSQKLGHLGLTDSQTLKSPNPIK